MGSRQLINDDRDQKGRCVWYVMQSLDVAENGALARAIKLASRREVPLVVVFCLDKDQSYLLDQLELVERALPENIPLMVMIGEMPERLVVLRHHTQPLAVIFDKMPASAVLSVLDGIQYEIISDTKKPFPDSSRIPHWPGRIIKITELRSVLASGEFC